MTSDSPDSLSLALPNAQATEQLGLYLGQTLVEGTVLLLKGDLGAGKTSLVQGIGQGLGIQDAIVSPTFTLINEYPEGRIPLYHLDLYRLEPQEIVDLNLALFWEGIEYPLGLVAIEWAERLLDLPPHFLLIELQIGETGRVALLQNQGASVDLRSLARAFA